MSRRFAIATCGLLAGGALPGRDGGDARQREGLSFDGSRQRRARRQGEDPDLDEDHVRQIVHVLDGHADPGQGRVPGRHLASTFATSEKAAGKFVPLLVIHGLGEAWATKSPGLLEVFDGHETIKIQAPLVATSKLEALARKLL